MKHFLLLAHDLFKVMNNDDGEVIITQDQPDEITDPKVRYLYQFIFSFPLEFHPSVHELRSLYSIVYTIRNVFFYLHGIIFNLTIWRFDNES